MDDYQSLKRWIIAISHYLHKNTITEGNYKEIINVLRLNGFIQTLVIKYPINELYRVSSNSVILESKKSFDNISFLKNPCDKKIKKFGRANVIGKSLLYATFEEHTALSEVHPKIGDMVTISKWKLKTSYDLTVAPIFNKTTKDGYVHNLNNILIKNHYDNVLLSQPEETKKIVELFIDFLTKCFIKEVDDNNHFDYLLSAYYTDQILNNYHENKVDAILYPSVKQSLTLNNIVMKPSVFNDHYELAEAKECIIISPPLPEDYSCEWNLAPTMVCKTHSNGRLIWE